MGRRRRPVPIDIQIRFLVYRGGNPPNLASWAWTALMENRADNKLIINRSFSFTTVYVSFTGRESLVKKFRRTRSRYENWTLGFFRFCVPWRFFSHRVRPLSYKPTQNSRFSQMESPRIVDFHFPRFFSRREVAFFVTRILTHLAGHKKGDAKGDQFTLRFTLLYFTRFIYTKKDT